MSATHGKSTVFKIDASGGGALTDISTYCDNVSGLPGGRAMDDVSAFGDAGERQTPGMPGAKFKVSGHWDNSTGAGAIKTIMNALRLATATASFEYGPEGAASGAVKYSGECWVEGFTVEATVKSRTNWSADCVVDNGVTTGTFSA